MRRSRALATWIATLALIGGSGGAAIAQAEDTTGPVAVVTGTEECHMTTPGTTTVGEDGVERYRGHISTCQPDVDDPRFAMSSEMVWETDCYPDGRCMMFGTSESLGPDGWRGVFTGWMDPSGVSSVGVYIGFGTNEGLTALGGSSGGDLSGHNTVNAIVYEGAPPPWPKLPDVAE